MKVKIRLLAPAPLSLPRDYNQLLQGAVYRLLDENFARWLHNRGFVYEKRSFKHFSFSGILERGRYHPNTQTFTFPSRFSIVLSSAVEPILEQFARNSVTHLKIRLGRYEMAVESVEILPRPEITENRIRIRTLSPIEVHSTLSKGDGSKKTYYYKPREREFGELVASNMAKKWEALYGEKCPYSLNMEPVRVEYLKSAVLKYKGFVIEGWKGHFWLEGEPEFLQFALDAGLGSRNSQGFGCVDRVLPREVSGVGNREFGKEGR